MYGNLPSRRNRRAIRLIIIALCITMYYVAEAKPIHEWWLPLLVIVTALVLLRPERHAESQTGMAPTGFTLRSLETLAPPAQTDQTHKVAEDLAPPSSKEEFLNPPTGS